MKAKTKLKKTDNPREYKLLRREATLNCAICPPHRGENATRTKHGTKKPKSKDKRK